MRSTKCLVAAAVLAAGIGTARADVYSIVTPLNGGFDDGAFDIGLNPAVFNDSLGALTGVTQSITGAVQVSVFAAGGGGNPPLQTPLHLEFQVGIRMDTYGFIAGPNSGSYVADAGTFPGNGDYSEVSGQGSVAASFQVPQAYVSAYADPRNAGELGAPDKGVVERVDVHFVQMNALTRHSMDRKALGVWS